jgi:putative DNA primase/helicase
MKTTQKPNILVPELTRIPSELTSCKQWVNWRLQLDDKERWTKVPYQPNGRCASTTNPATWSSFDVVMAAYQSGRFDGIGFVLTKASGIVAIDMDKIKAHRHDPRFRDVFIKLGESGTYMEVSPSSGGVHAFAFGTLPFDGKNSREAGIEMYAAKRYLTVTGHTLEGTGTTLKAIQNVLDEIVGIAYPDAGVCHD